MRRDAVWIGLAIVVAAWLSTSGVLAGTPVIKERGKVLDTFELQSGFLQAGTTTETRYTVPPGQQLVVTDVLITNFVATEAAYAALLRDDAHAITTLAVPAGHTLFVPLASGVVFDEGQRLAFGSVDGVAGHSWFIGGYLKKKKKQ